MSQAFSVFERTFRCDSAAFDAGETDSSLPECLEVAGLRRDQAGRSFESGLYRIMNRGTSDRVRAMVSEAFPALTGGLVPFAFDWMGRVFCVNTCQGGGRFKKVELVDPGAGAVLSIACEITEFHDKELVDFRDASLASEFFAEWQAGGGAAPKYGQCVGYRKPLFLSGADEVSNLELTDAEVYWGIMFQLIGRVRGLPPGTRIEKIEIRE